MLGLLVLFVLPSSQRTNLHSYRKLNLDHHAMPKKLIKNQQNRVCWGFWHNEELQKTLISDKSDNIVF